MKKFLTLTTLITAVILMSCSNNPKKEQAKKGWKEKAYSETTNAEAVPATETKAEYVKVLADKDFDKVIASGVTMVDLWATWCRPCLIQAPIVEQIAGEYAGKVNVYKMDVDKNPYVPQRFNIQNIPTLMIFKDGKMVERFTGLQDKSTLVDALNKHQANS